MEKEKKAGRKYYPEEVFAAILMALMVILCFINILARFVFKKSMVFTDQLLLQIWPCVIFLAAPVCCVRKSLTAFTLISDHFPGKEKWFELITAIAGILSFSFLFYYGVIKCYSYYSTGFHITSLGNFPVWIFYLAIPIGSALYIVRSVQLCIRAFRGDPEVKEDEA